MMKITPVITAIFRGESCTFGSIPVVDLFVFIFFVLFVIDFGVNKSPTPIYDLTGEREGLQPSLSPIVQIYAALQSSFVAVFAGRGATADELTPLSISQTTNTIF